MSKTAGPTDSVHIRMIDAPREVVFDAWTTPEILARWWGPDGFTDTILEFDPRPGGHWKHIMHGPNGVDYPNESVFVEIIRPERIAMRHIAPPFLIIAEFGDRDGRTEMTFCQRFGTEEELEKMKRVIVNANEENLDRLEAVVRDSFKRE